MTLRIGLGFVDFAEWGHPTFREQFLGIYLKQVHKDLALSRFTLVILENEILEIALKFSSRILVR